MKSWACRGSSIDTLPPPWRIQPIYLIKIIRFSHAQKERVAEMWQLANLDDFILIKNKTYNFLIDARKLWHIYNKLV